MNLNLDLSLAKNYKNKSQKIRVITENWVYNNIYCPNCGSDISKYANNKPVGDFYCEYCKEDFELKSKKGNIGKKIIGGAYLTMIERLKSDMNPNFFFLNYDSEFEIINFMLIPKYYITPEIIEKRKPLSLNARRAGWVGCNILLNNIPESGKIFYIYNKKVQSKKKVLNSWRETNFLKHTENIVTKSWLIDIINCIEKLHKQSFTLKEIYQCESYFKSKYPQNNNIKAKIRQQLQILRDKNYLIFDNGGKYKKV